jgi:hypothetical protein
MFRISVLLFSTVSLLSASAQPGSYSRCEIKRTEAIDRFEQWLHLKQIRSARKLTTIYKIPVVVHVLHRGEPVGEGFNYAAERIESQIRTLNEDFRRKEGTPGFNSHPDGGDTRIEFILAQIDPEGNPTNGIVRVNINSVNPPPLPPGRGDAITICTLFSYWDPEQYLNIWCADQGHHGLYLGSGRFPVSDLEGLPGQSEDGDGVEINAINFGQGEINTLPNFNMGRTLTHEMGHFLGLLHTFGPPGDCSLYSDYCDDTPPVSSSSRGCPSEKPLACNGGPAMIENYMDYSYDRCMNIFTNDQIARMRTVLENSPRRKSLLTSPVINRLEEDVTGIQDDNVHPIKIYPNPATNRLYLAADEKIRGHIIYITAHTLLGKTVFKKTIVVTGTEIEILLSETSEKFMILTIEGFHSSHKQLIMIN